MMNYGMNPYLQQQPQRFISPFRMYAVSNIMEANATPVENLDPVFFYNKAENVVYKKQIDGTGAAPIQTFKLSLTAVEEEKPINNVYEDNFKAINDRLDGIEKLLEEKKGKFNVSTVTNNDKPYYQQQSASDAVIQRIEN